MVRRTEEFNVSAMELVCSTRLHDIYQDGEKVLVELKWWTLVFIWNLCATDKRRISAVQLSRTLDIRYDSAKNYLLSGIVELDDGYIGGNSHNGKRGRGTGKPKIVVVLSKSANGAALCSRNQSRMWRLQKLSEFGRCTTGAHEVWSRRSALAAQGNQQSKNVLFGNYHGRCTKLQAYLDEFCFRFNRRMIGDQVFLCLIRAVTTSCGVLN